MGALSTLRISREMARATLFQRYLTMSDDELVRAIDRIAAEHFINVRITPDGEDDQEFERYL